MGAPFNPSATMGSSKIAAFAFIRQFIVEWQRGPSLSEIANAIGRSKDTARRAVRRLDHEGLIIRTPGERGIRLPDVPKLISRDEALARLRDEGFVIDEDVLHVSVPGPARPITTLPLLAKLDHIPDIDFSGDSHDIDRGRTG